MQFKPLANYRAYVSFQVKSKHTVFKPIWGIPLEVAA